MEGNNEHREKEGDGVWVKMSDLGASSGSRERYILPTATHEDGKTADIEPVTSAGAESATSAHALQGGGRVGGKGENANRVLGWLGLSGKDDAAVRGGGREDGHAGNGDGRRHGHAQTYSHTHYRVYKRRWFGLAQLVLLNIVVSWDVSLVSFYLFCPVPSSFQSSMYPPVFLLNLWVWIMMSRLPTD